LIVPVLTEVPVSGFPINHQTGTVSSGRSTEYTPFFETCTMCFTRPILSGLLIGVWVLSAFCGRAAAQVEFNELILGKPSAQETWEQRVLRRPQSNQAASAHRAGSQRVAQRQSPYRQGKTQARSGRVMMASANLAPKAEQGALLTQPPNGEYDDIKIDPVPMEYADEMTGGCDCYGGSCQCDDTWCEPCDECGPCYEGYWGGCGWWGPWGWKRGLREFSICFGMHGFKGPRDRGQNGNFGFHEGVNYGAPLGGITATGYQLGMLATHSNFSGGGPLSPTTGDRDQIFFTGGLFRRAVCGGWQWAVAVDVLQDTYGETANLSQIRTEFSFVRVDRRELGFWGAFGTQDDRVTTGDQERLGTLEPTDLYAFFHRRYFSGGGEGRLWSGFTGHGDALIGGDIRVPLGTSWALENNFSYLIPKESRSENGWREETWAVNIHLVWYPGRAARSVRSNPYHPVLSVADNSVFMTDLH